MYQFIKPFLDNKMSIFEGYEAFISFNATPSSHQYCQLVDSIDEKMV